MIRATILLPCAVLLLGACRQDSAALPDPVPLTPEAVGYFCQMNLLEHDGPKAQLYLKQFPQPLFVSGQLRFGCDGCCRKLAKLDIRRQLIRELPRQQFSLADLFRELRRHPGQLTFESFTLLPQTVALSDENVLLSLLAAEDLLQVISNLGERHFNSFAGDLW